MSYLQSILRQWISLQQFLICGWENYCSSLFTQKYEMNLYTFRNKKLFMKIKLWRMKRTASNSVEWSLSLKCYRKADSTLCPSFSLSLELLSGAWRRLPIMLNICFLVSCGYTWKLSFGIKKTVHTLHHTCM